MKAVISPANIKYAENFVRPAIAPEAIVTAVAANTTWKKKSVAPDSPPDAHIPSSPRVAAGNSKSELPDRNHDPPPINHPPPPPYAKAYPTA